MKHGVKLPSPATLKKYGLSLAEWDQILERQGYVCPICQKMPTSGRFYVDHEHLTGWKKMPAEKRKLAVRGLLCYMCNRYHVAKGITIFKARNIVKYLIDYEDSKIGF